MKVYVDIIFFINLMYDFLILSSVNIVLRRGIKNKKILIASIFSSVISIFSFLPFLNNIFFILVILLLTNLIAFGYKDFIYFKNNTIYFLLISIIYGGSVYLIDCKFNNFYNPVDQYNKRVLVNLFCLLIYAPITYFLYLYYYKKNMVNNKNYYDVTLSVSDKVHYLKGFYDSGNLIKDPYKGSAVILVDEDILYGDIKNKSPIYVPVSTINSSSLIKCYKPQLLIINDKVIKNCIIGLWNNKHFNDGIDVIISGYMGDAIL